LNIANLVNLYVEKYGLVVKINPKYLNLYLIRTLFQNINFKDIFNKLDF